MSQKNETTLLVLTFAITSMLLGGIVLWLIQHSTTNQNQNPQTASKTVTVAQSSDSTTITAYFKAFLAFFLKSSTNPLPLQTAINFHRLKSKS